MKKIYSKVLSFSVLSLLISGSVFSQAPTLCGPGDANICSTPAQNFNSGTGGFVVAGVEYNPVTGRFENPDADGGTSVTITSPAYTKGASIPFVTTGFSFTGSSDNINFSVTISILDGTSDNVLAACSDVAPNLTSFCAGIQDNDLIGVTSIRYRFTIDFEAPNNRLFVFDDFVAPPGATVVPITLKSFNAKRSNNNVLLSWETETEANSKGFAIQRKNASGVFETITFVNTKAADGNSVDDLSYQFSDLNTANAASQYRIMMVDLDGRSKYSVIRMVEGLRGTKVKVLIYPNPSRNAPVNVVFGNSDARNIQLTDLAGRVHNSWRNYTNQDLKINKLIPGQYLLRVTTVATNEQETHRITITD